MTKYNSKEKIIEHYDLVSPYYHSLWGEHLHHGYWVTGKETREEAQVALIKKLADAAAIKPADTILDIGCGFGASSIYLAQHYRATVTGITISPVQVAMAEKAAQQAQVKAQFLLMDADAITLQQSFDILWSIESISHYSDKENFFKTISHLCKAGGTVAIIDWFKKESLSISDYTTFIRPIEKGMLVELHSMHDYERMLTANGLKVTQSEDLSSQTSKTWDIALDIIKNKKFWWLAIKNGRSFVHFLRSFKAMRAGFASKRFVYGLIIAKKK